MFFMMNSRNLLFRVVGAWLNGRGYSRSNRLEFSSETSATFGFRRSEEPFAQDLAMGGSLDPAPHSIDDAHLAGRLSTRVGGGAR